ncbi:SAM-dependent methyltransferase [Anaerovorax sp. IOR16]|uniref:SAM-dependent methyltransferase n=1 Tax=Anaerovorax sp. IOR16 TaxID=2773458 RepID=UPI0019D278E0|nr:cyclopropane-fatty-acyl-phospholipid synthase family protein [Anaerovorax sp. IOR16]
MIFEKIALKRLLNQWDQVPFQVQFMGEDVFTVGKGEPVFSTTIHKPIPKKELIKSTSLALGEAYMRRDIEIEGDLFTALNVVLSHIDKFSVNSKALDTILHTSTKEKYQKKEVCSHYDIGNDFYQLWLDETLNYSCGYFKNDDDTLYQAQVNKVEKILKKLQLKKGMTLLDIGCGWGYLLIEAAKKYGIQGLGITLSEEQYRTFQQKIEEEHLEDQLEVRCMDYRKLRRSHYQFDRVVSIGMIEHVGRDNYDLFFENVDSVLKPKGVFLLQYISALRENPGDPWMKKYIFPGGVIPSLREILKLCGDYNFYTVDVESLRRHYVKTLLCWYRNFEKAKPQVMAQYSDSFARMWELYLCACAASFNNGVIDLHQLLLTKETNNDLPMRRTEYEF